jgi:hypothetical protein
MNKSDKKALLWKDKGFLQMNINFHADKLILVSSDE